MKKIVLAIALFSSMTTVAFADQICGTVGQHNVGPHCAAGGPCPMWVKLQFDLVTADGQQIDVNPTTSDLFGQFTSLRGQQVCITGEFVNNDFTFSAVSPE
jgi:hypothetical protein